MQSSGNGREMPPVPPDMGSVDALSLLPNDTSMPDGTPALMAELAAGGMNGAGADGDA